MTRICTVCAHKKVDEINMLLISGESYRRIASRFNLIETSVRRHKAAHIPEELLKAEDIKEYTTAEQLAHRLKDDSDLVREMRDQAKDDGDINLALKAIDRSLKCIELCAKVQGLIQEQSFNINNTQVNLLQHDPEWIALRTLIVNALDPYPEAREAIVNAIAEKRNRNRTAEPRGN